ncbi:MAG: RNA polymerase sigma factor FliA [Aquificaceae bacterium]|nr:RNA polymerase sigma factor FliA [Aquificaceae bacterium]MDW8294920.1 RNA polymerase sigma factor FliA [Aquificaceae bacterium]
MTKEEKELVLSYLPLVQRIAYRLHRHLPSSVDVNDLIGYGVLALIEVLPKVDRSKNPTAYLKLRVKGAMYDYLRSLDFVSRNIRSKEKAIKQALERLSMERGEEVSDEELAKFLGESPEKLKEDLKAISFSYLMSLEELFREGRSYEELFESQEEGPEEAVIRADLKEKLLKAIERLDYRERLLLQLLYYEELPLKEVAKLLGVSMARVSQIKSSAIEKLRNYLNPA